MGRVYDVLQPPAPRSWGPPHSTTVSCHASLCLPTCDGNGENSRRPALPVQAIVDRLKAVDDCAMLAVCRVGGWVAACQVPQQPSRLNLLR